MKPALRITLIITLFFCLYSNICVFFISPILKSIFIKFFPGQNPGNIESALLILVFTLTTFLICYWLLKNYLIEQKKNVKVRDSWEKIAKSEENYKTLINRISDGFLSLDKQLRYTYANKKIEEMTGKTQEELLGKYIWDVFPEAVNTPTSLAIEKSLKEQIYVYNTDHYEPLNIWQENHIYPSTDGLSIFIRDVSEEKRNKLILEKKENHFRSLIENTEDIISLNDKDGNIIYASPAFERASGYTSKEIETKTMFDLMPPENVDPSKNKFEDLINSPGIIFKAANQMRSRSGEYRFIEGTIINLLEDKNVGAILCNFRDVTERIKSEEILRESEAHYRNLFENLMHGFAYFKVMCKEKDIIDDYMFLSTNKNYLNMTGFKDVEGKLLSEVIPGIKISNDQLYQVFGRVALNRTPESFEIYIELLNMWYYVSVYSPQEGYIIALVDNITDKKKQDEQKSLFATIVTSSQDAIFSRNLDDIITSWNYSAEKLFGYTAEEAIGMNARDFVPAAIVNESYITSEKLINNESIKHYETQRIKKNGELVNVALTISPIIKEEQVIGASIIARDITDKKIAEEKIRFSENNLSAIIENATEAFILMDKNLKILTFNKKAGDSSVLNYLKVKMEHGASMVDYIDPGRKSLLFSIHEKILKGETIQYENDYYSTAEKKQWYNTCFTPVWENGKVNGVCVALRDITDIKTSQEKISKSEENLRAIFDNALQAFILMDPDGTIVAFNQHAIRHVKVAYEADIRLGISLLDILDEKMTKFLKGIISKTLTGETFQVNRAFETDRGKLIWLDFTISPVTRDNKISGFCIVGSDITEKKSMEREREFERKNLESLINNTGDLMWSVDSKRHLITYNQPFAELVLHSTGLPVNKDTDLLAIQYDEKTRKRFKGFYERALAGESFTEIIDNEIPDLTWSEISFYPIYNGVEVAGTACFLRNITERKKHEQLLIKNANEKELFIKELSQNNKDLQQFAYITSHNLRGPIASLLGLSNLLSGYEIENPTLKQILSGIHQATLRFDETIKDLNTILTVKETGSKKSETLLFSNTFEKVIEQCDLLIRNSEAEIYYDFNSAPQINFNKSYLESIFLNLLTNALKYREESRPLKIQVTTEVSENYAILKFRDNGIGMDLDLHRGKIFKLYQRFHNSIEGKGLGLFLIKSQLESFDASIEIESELNRGTDFTIKFPHPNLVTV